MARFTKDGSLACVEGRCYPYNGDPKTPATGIVVHLSRWQEPSLTQPEARFGTPMCNRHAGSAKSVVTRTGNGRVHVVPLPALATEATILDAVTSTFKMWRDERDKRDAAYRAVIAETAPDLRHDHLFNVRPGTFRVCLAKDDYGRVWVNPSTTTTRLTPAEAVDFANALLAAATSARLGTRG